LGASSIAPSESEGSAEGELLTGTRCFPRARRDPGVAEESVRGRTFTVVSAAVWSSSLSEGGFDSDEVELSEVFGSRNALVIFDFLLALK